MIPLRCPNNTHDITFQDTYRPTTNNKPDWTWEWIKNSEHIQIYNRSRLEMKYPSFNKSFESTQPIPMSSPMVPPSAPAAVSAVPSVVPAASWELILLRPIKLEFHMAIPNWPPAEALTRFTGCQVGRKTEQQHHLVKDMWNTYLQGGAPWLAKLIYHIS